MMNLFHFVRTFQGKARAANGLTAEFYLSFWELLRQELVDTFNYAFEKTEYIKGCFIGQNIRLLADIREHDDDLVEDDRK